MNSTLNLELNSEIPFIMHLDSANAHDPIVISNRIRRWLVFEWHLLKGQMGSKNIFMECYSPTITPAVATQSNTYDCALYVCRYALGLYFIRDQRFTYKDVFVEKTPLLSKLSSNILFQFDQYVVKRFRHQLRVLILNLCQCYHSCDLTTDTTSHANFDDNDNQVSNDDANHVMDNDKEGSNNDANHDGGLDIDVLKLTNDPALLKEIAPLPTDVNVDSFILTQFSNEEDVPQERVKKKRSGAKGQNVKAHQPKKGSSRKRTQAQ